MTVYDNVWELFNMVSTKILHDPFINDNFCIKYRAIFGPQIKYFN